MLWTIGLEDSKYQVTLPDTIVSGEPFQLKVKDKSWKVRWVASARTLYLIDEKDGKLVEQPLALRSMDIERFAGDPAARVQFSINQGRPVKVQASAKRYVPGEEHREKARASKGALVRSPITGKVVKVGCENGQTVEAGSTVMVIEAMKMENNIFAPSGGVVSKLKVKPGDSVSVGEELLAIKADK